MILGSVEATISVVAVALISPLLTYLIAARKLSGRIKDTDATELWAESKAIREWSTARVKELNDHVDELERRLNEVEKTNTDLVEQNRTLTRTAYDWRRKLEEKEDEVVALKRLLAQKQRADERTEEGGLGG